MLTNFDVMANKDIVNYYNWFQHKSKNNTYIITAAVDPYSNYDLIQYKSYNDYSFIELKGRNVNITDYPDCVVELNKITSLQELCRQSNRKVFIIAMYYPSSKLAIWEIKPDINYNTIKKYCNKTTAADNGKINKDMVHLPLNEARIYKMNYIVDV